jgi:hypothetical protein
MAHRIEHYHQHDHSAYRCDQNARQIDARNTWKPERLEDRANDKSANDSQQDVRISPSSERFTIFADDPLTSPDNQPCQNTDVGSA